MKDHLASSCPEKIVPCRQADNGCTWRGRRVSLESHVNQCPYESIKGFFAIHGTQVGQLSKDNERLRRRTDELEGTVRILRQELESVKIALRPWYRPTYPERPSMPANYTQSPNNEDASTGSAPSRVEPIILRGVDPTNPTSRPEPRVENHATETFDLFDPFSFVSQRRSEDSSVHTTNTTSTTMDSNANPSTNVNDHAVWSYYSHDLDGHTTHEPHPGSSHGSESTHNTTGTALSPGASNLQSTFTAPPVTLFSDHFPSEDQGFEGGSSSRPQGWQHVPSSTNPTPSNASPSIYSPVSSSVLATQKARGFTVC